MNDYLIRYHLGMEPDNMSDEKWAEAIAFLEQIRKEERKG
jgi:hypothetical protein